MPSNCLRSPLPVCFSTWTPSQPHPSQRCPSAPSPLPVSITAGFLSHMSCFITGRPRVASVLLNRVKSSAAQVRGARWNTRRHLLWIFNLPARILTGSPAPVVKFAGWCFFYALDGAVQSLGCQKKPKSVHQSPTTYRPRRHSIYRFTKA